MQTQTHRTRMADTYADLNQWCATDASGEGASGFSALPLNAEPQMLAPTGLGKLLLEGTADLRFGVLEGIR